MVQILPKRQSFGEILGQGLGAGLSQGIGQAGQFGMEIAKEKMKQQRLQSYLTPKSQSEMGEQLQGEMPESQSLYSQLDPQQRLALSQEFPEVAREIREQEKIGSREKLAKRKEAFSETKDYRTHIADQARAAEELDPVLDQMEHLIKKGKLTNPIIAKLADKFGLVGLLDPSSQQFQGLSVGFLSNAKNVFGARLTNLDVQTYLDKMPRLAQTNEGKKTIISNFRALGEASKVRNKIKNKIIKENHGVPPLDLEEKVSERTEPELDRLFDKFNKGFYKPSKTDSGKILMRNRDGILGEVPEEKIKEAIEKGYQLQ